MTIEPSFIRLSTILTGIDELPVVLAPDYRARLVAICGDAAVGAILALVDALPAEDTGASLIAQVTADQALAAVAEQLVMLWYASATLDPAGELTFGTTEQYFSSQLWSVIRAHPPALSGGYMGHWRYPPE